jgi:hypothetical protein
LPTTRRILSQVHRLVEHALGGHAPGVFAQLDGLVVPHVALAHSREVLIGEALPGGCVVQGEARVLQRGL